MSIQRAREKKNMFKYNFCEFPSSKNVFNRFLLAHYHLGTKV